jgi:uncharacterized phiE125 gp8 family phage protein
MALRLVTAPPVKPLTLDQLKAHLRVDTSDEDELLLGILDAAVEHAEAVTKRALVYQSWDWLLECFPRWFEVPKAPLIQVEHIKYLDDSGAEQTLATSVYRVDSASQPGRVTLDYGQVWPSTYPVPNAVTLRFACGYFLGGSPTDYRADVPRSINQGLLLLAGHFYENREAISMAPNIQELPLGVRALLTPHVVSWF